MDPGNVHHGFFAAAPIPSRLPAQRVGSVADEKKKRQTDARRGLLPRRVPSCWSKAASFSFPQPAPVATHPFVNIFLPAPLWRGQNPRLCMNVSPATDPPPPTRPWATSIPHELGEMFIKLGRLPPPTRMLFRLDESDDPRA